MNSANQMNSARALANLIGFDSSKKEILSAAEPGKSPFKQQIATAKELEYALASIEEWDSYCPDTFDLLEFFLVARLMTVRETDTIIKKCIAICKQHVQGAQGKPLTSDEVQSAIALYQFAMKAALHCTSHSFIRKTKATQFDELYSELSVLAQDTEEALHLPLLTERYTQFTKVIQTPT